MDKPNHLDYPNNEAGWAAYDAAVADYKREQNPLIGKEFVDNVENVAGQVAQIPGVKQGLQFLGGAAKWVDETMTQDEGVGGQLYRSYQTLKDTSEQQFGDLVENLGVDRRIGSFVGGEVIDTLATAGAGSIAGKAAKLIDTLPPGGMSPKLVTANGGMQFSAPPTPTKGGPVSELTVTNPEVIAPGVKPGVGQSDRFKSGVAKLRAQGDADDARIADYLGQFERGELTTDQLKERLGKVKKRGDAKYSTMQDDPLDPDIFEVPSQKNVDPTNPQLRLDQHHAATKAMTTPWVKRALKLGDDDDVVALFELHRMLTGSGMGNAKSGIIDAPGVIHDTAKASRAGRDTKQAIHSFMKKGGAGVEIPQLRLKKLLVILQTWTNY